MLKVLRCAQKPWHSCLKGDADSLLLLVCFVLLFVGAIFAIRFLQMLF